MFGNLDKKISSYKEEIYELDVLDDVFGLEETEIIRRNEVTGLLLRDLKNKESLVSQKARNKWLRDGDNNSKYFHRCINIRRKKNEICGMLINGAWCEEVQPVKQGISNHFCDQFRRSTSACLILGDELITRKVSESDNLMLTAPFREEEVREALGSCDMTKSPGPDGFNFCFLLEFWDIYKNDFMNLLSEFYHNGKFVRGFNPSFIVLIPKKEETVSMHDFRPISLLGGAYKIISKLLATRLSKVLDSVISPNQSAFVGGRQILDSVVILNEAIDEAKKKKCERMFLKLDFAKAYDNIEWGFLEHMMERLGFHSRWRMWIMECISSASASVLVNDSPSDEFVLEKGLRQGDPLSPFLFLIVAEGFSLLMRKATELNFFQPALIGNDNIKISHLQFADDTIIMGEAALENVSILRSILCLTELLSGLRVNFDKSCFFGINIQESRIYEMANLLGCAVGSLPINYLGIKVGTSH